MCVAVDTNRRIITIGEETKKQQLLDREQTIEELEK